MLVHGRQRLIGLGSPQAGSSQGEPVHESGYGCIRGIEQDKHPGSFSYGSVRAGVTRLTKLAAGKRCSTLNGIMGSNNLLGI